MWRKRATPLHHWITGGAVTAAKIWSRERTRMLSGFPNPEHLRGELRIDFDELRGDDGPQDAQRLGGRSGRHRHVRRLVEIKAGMLHDLGDAMAGVYARKREASPLWLEAEQAAIGDERDRPAGAMHIARARSRRADEIDLCDQCATAVLEPEQDHLGHDVIEVRGPEGAGKTHRGLRVVADADEVDVALAVDLSAREEERVDAALPGAVEQLAPAVGEEALPAAAQQRDLRPAVAALARQQRRRRRNRRGRAHRHVTGITDQAGNDAGKQLFVAVRPIALKQSEISRSSLPRLTRQSIFFVRSRSVTRALGIDVPVEI